MPVPCCIFIPIHPCISVDLHQNVPPPPAPPVPPYLPYFWLQVLGGLPLVNKAKMGTKTFTFYFPAMQKDTDIGKLIVHVGNPVNTLLPKIILGSSSQSFFGASTVKVEGETVATALVLLFGKNMNCCDPMNLPTGNVIAPNTVIAGMTLGDYVAGVINIVVAEITSRVNSKIDALGDSIKSAAAEGLKDWMSKSAWNYVVGEAMKYGAGKAVDAGVEEAKALFEEATGSLGEDAGSAIDSALDGSDSNSTGESSQNYTSGSSAVGDYYNDSELFS